MTTLAIHNYPQTYARIGGIIYLFIIIAAGFAEIYVRGSLISWNDPIATASNICASETLFRTGLVGELLTCVCDVTLSMILFILLKPVNRNIALLGAFFRLVFVSIYCVTKLFEIVALISVSNSDALKIFDPLQLQALAYVSLRVHSLGYGMSLLFFGFNCVLFGYLIAQSAFLPKVIGMVLAMGGAGYIVFSLCQVMNPAFAARVLFPWLGLPAFAGELWLALWLTIKGVNVMKWNQAAAV